MPLTPPRSTSGEITWSDTLTSTVKCSDVDASQEISVSIDHTLHVYYANARNDTEAYPEDSFENMKQSWSNLPLPRLRQT
jgi:hypothetical protein